MMNFTTVLSSEKFRQPEQNSAPETQTDSIRAQLERVLASELFLHSRRYPALLRHVVERTLDGGADELKERTLGITVFKRNPEYDTSADPVVRTTASEVRKRLEEYYSDPNHAGELRIGLPAGAYHPEFRLPTITPPPSPSTPVTRIRRWRVWAVAAAMLLVCLAVAIGAYSNNNALDEFWKPVLKASPVLVVVETWIGAPKPINPRDSSPVQDLIDPNSFLLLNEINSKMAVYFGANHRTLEYQLARNVTIAKLRSQPFILRGGFNNPLSRQAVSSLPYSLNFLRTPSSAVRQIVDRQDATAHWDAPLGPLSRDYALIARAPEPQTGQTMVVIAGLGERGTAAATEFLTNRKYMDDFARTAPRGWERRNIEIVLQTQLSNADWGEPHIVATKVW